MPSSEGKFSGIRHVDVTSTSRSLNMSEIPLPGATVVNSSIAGGNITDSQPSTLKFNIKQSLKVPNSDVKRAKPSLSVGVIPKSSGPEQGSRIGLFKPTEADEAEVSAANHRPITDKPVFEPSQTASVFTSPPQSTVDISQQMMNSQNNNRQADQPYTKILRPDQALLQPGLQHLNPQKLRSAQMIAMPLICRQPDPSAVQAHRRQSRSSSRSSSSSYSSRSSSSSSSRSSSRGRRYRGSRRSRSPLISSRRWPGRRADRRPPPPSSSRRSRRSPSPPRRSRRSRSRERRRERSHRSRDRKRSSRSPRSNKKSTTKSSSRRDDKPRSDRSKRDRSREREKEREREKDKSSKRCSKSSRSPPVESIVLAKNKAAEAKL